jgi:hypothetical protein
MVMRGFAGFRAAFNFLDVAFVLGLIRLGPIRGHH